MGKMTNRPRMPVYPPPPSPMSGLWMDPFSRQATGSHAISATGSHKEVLQSFAGFVGHEDQLLAYHSNFSDYISPFYLLEIKLV